MAVPEAQGPPASAPVTAKVPAGLAAGWSINTQLLARSPVIRRFPAASSTASTLPSNIVRAYSISTASLGRTRFLFRLFML